MSWRNQALTWALRRWIKPNSLRDQTIAQARARTGGVSLPAKLAPGWRIRTVQSGALNGEWIEPTAPGQTARRRCILYLHGGGYIAMSARTHRAITSRLATWGDASLFALDYRLAPEFPFPAALEDALAAWRALIALGARPSHMLVAGDSAGGGLAMALLLALRDAKESLPNAAVLFSPWTDLAATGESIVANSNVDALIFGAWVAPMARHYLAGTPATNPLVSPIYADLTGLPALFIQVSDSEVLLDDSRRLVENARQARVETTLKIWPCVPHGWQIFASFLPEARDALREASDFIASRWGSTG
jgi:monoterpene epsilon-lactone hydrolase